MDKITISIFAATLGAALLVKLNRAVESSCVLGMNTTTWRGSIYVWPNKPSAMSS